MRMSPLELDKNVPFGRDAVATRPQHGDINNESERTGTIEGDGGCQGSKTDAGAGVGTDGVCYRQSKRIWRRYQDDGDAGLVHRLRGKPSARRKPSALRTQVLARYAEERYADFGPTLMAEHLSKEKLVVDHETLRRWRMAEGRTPCAAASKAPAMAGTQAVLWGDGATGWLAPRLVRGARPPVRVDGDGGRCDQPDAGAVLRGRDHAGQLRCAGGLGAPDMDCRAACMWIGTASTGAKGWRASPNNWPEKSRRRSLGGRWRPLGVELILANSPQAKGRVERMNGVLQDRLVKEMRLAGINDMESANRFLDEKYLRAFNRQFARAAASPMDAHRTVPRHLNEVLSGKKSAWCRAIGRWRARGSGINWTGTRGVEPGAAEGDRADTAERAGATDVSG